MVANLAAWARQPTEPHDTGIWDVADEELVAALERHLALAAVAEQRLLVAGGLGEAADGDDHEVVVAERPQTVVDSQCAFLHSARPLRGSLLREAANWWMWAASTILPAEIVVRR